jgi:hypothetical protein
MALVTLFSPSECLHSYSVEFCAIGCSLYISIKGSRAGKVTHIYTWPPALSTRQLLDRFLVKIHMNVLKTV